MTISMGAWVNSLPDDLLDVIADMDLGIVETLVGANEGQLRAILHLDGPTQINAVAGSGKTFVLTRRINYMRLMGIKPQNILCTTFTKKATGEMKDRMTKLMSTAYINLMTLGTTHSIGYRILSREYKSLNHHLARAFDPKKDILMGNDQKRFMENVKKDIMKDMTVPFEIKQEINEIAIPQFNKAFGLAKNEGIGHREYEGLHGDNPSKRMQAYVLMYNRYEQKKWDDVVVDGDDLLFLLVRLLEEHDDIRAKYQRQFKYLLIDEAQDNNALQNKLIGMLGYPEYNIFLVGDDDQAMYSFRGAKPEEFIQFSKTYKMSTQIPLELNYRSNPGILKAANMLIRNNDNRIVKQLRSGRPDDFKDEPCVMYTPYGNDDEEAAGVVEQMEILVDKEGYEHKQMAVIYRTNAQSRAVEDKLIMSGLPYVIHGGVSFYERSEVKDLVAYLQLAINPHDKEAFKRIYNKPKRYLGKAFESKVMGHRTSPWAAINDSLVVKSFTYEKKGVAEIVALISHLNSMVKKGEKAVDILDYVVEQGGYKAFITEEGDEEEEGNSRMENVATLKYVVDRFDEVEKFLEYIKMMTSTAKHDINGVQLMTFHRSKGLEFRAAFIVGCSEGLLPHYKAVEDQDEMVAAGKPDPIQEERRLGYVGVTRAEEQCFLSSVRSFNGKPAGPSRFINEMREALVVRQATKQDIEEPVLPDTIGEGDGIYDIPDGDQSLSEEFSEDDIGVLFNDMGQMYADRDALEEEKSELRRLLRD